MVDDPGNPGVALNEVQKFVGQGVLAIVDQDIDDDATWNSYVEQKGIPVFDPSGFHSLQLTENPKVFSVAVSEFQLANQIVIGAQKIGGKKLAVLYCAEAPVCAQEVAPDSEGG